MILLYAKYSAILGGAKKFIVGLAYVFYAKKQLFLRDGTVVSTRWNGCFFAKEIVLCVSEKIFSGTILHFLCVENSRNSRQNQYTSVCSNPLRQSKQKSLQAVACRDLG